MAIRKGLPLMPGQMLERAADAARQIDLGLHGFSGRAHLTRLLHPLGIDYRPRATHRGAQRFGQFLGDGDIVLFLNAAADRNQHRVLGDIDVASLGDDGLQIAPACGQSADFTGLVNHAAVEGSACLRLERARTDA